MSSPQFHRPIWNAPDKVLFKAAEQTSFRQDYTLWAIKPLSVAMVECRFRP